MKNFLIAAFPEIADNPLEDASYFLLLAEDAPAAEKIVAKELFEEVKENYDGDFDVFMEEYQFEVTEFTAINCQVVPA